MGKFYTYRGSKLISTGVCPDGQEHLQAVDGLSVGLGEPPADVRPEIVEQVPGYSDLRRREYPQIGDQLDALWKLLGPTAPPSSDAAALYARIDDVKRRFPKP